MVERREALRDQRRAVGMSQERLAEVLEVSVNAVRAWESGVRSPSPRYRQPLAEALQINLAELNQFLGIVAPIQLNGHEVPTWLTHYESLVQGAGELRKVELLVVPGLLQSRAYTEAAELASCAPLGPEQLQAAIDLRQARKQVLSRTPDPLRLTVLLSEGALRDVVGNAEVMVEQLDHLLELADQPNIDLRILGPGRAVAAVSGFELLTRRGDQRLFMACTFDVGGARYHEDPDVIAKFDHRFDLLFRTALSAASTVDRIHRIRRSLTP